MIAPASKARQGRLFPGCRIEFCRSIATETLLQDGKPFWCMKHLRWALELK